MDKVYNEEYLDGVTSHTEFKKMQLKQDKAERILWKFISHNIRHWWD